MRCKRCGYDPEMEERIQAYMQGLQTLKGTEDERRRAEYIIQEVAMERGISVASIKGESRRRQFVSARHEAIRRVKAELKDMQLKELGLLFGGRNHSTIIHALKGGERVG